MLPQKLLCAFCSWWGLLPLPLKADIWLLLCSPPEHMHRPSEIEQSPISLRSVIWHPVLLQNITCSWGQTNETYVSIYLVGVWNCAQVNAQCMLALQGRWFPLILKHRVLYACPKYISPTLKHWRVLRMRRMFSHIKNGKRFQLLNLFTILKFINIFKIPSKRNITVYLICILFVFLESPKEILPSFLYFNGMILLLFHRPNLQKDVVPHAPKMRHNIIENRYR